MKVVVAIDSMKGSLSSLEAGNAVKNGIEKVFSNADVVVRPLADGGEGTVEAITLGMNGKLERVKVTGPLGKKVEAVYGIIDDDTSKKVEAMYGIIDDNTSKQGKIAVIEMASAAGITLIDEAERNPLKTTTYGVGEIIKDAISKGCRRFIVGIGGSATNDCGVGMLQALGFQMLNTDGRQVGYGAEGLKDIVNISSENVIPELTECTFRVACDVTNPLCGINGCSRVFAPQKGATEEMVNLMDEWMKNFAAICKKQYPHADKEKPGTGAAGGLGFAFMTFMDAVLESGVNIVLEETKLEDYICEADIVITGEGRMDAQTVMGKAPVGVAALAKKYDKKVIAFAGSVSEDVYVCNDYGIDAIFPILRQVVSLEDAMDKINAEKNLMKTTEQVFRVIKNVKQ